MAATKRNAAGLTSAVPRATLNDEELPKEQSNELRRRKKLISSGMTFRSRRVFSLDGEKGSEKVKEKRKETTLYRTTRILKKESVDTMKMALVVSQGRAIILAPK
ncbi:hypothetical protein K0M31_002847 [Melipona bicolor]|uniref:Uncharacterized protein n=1 Tax=Melipona bicolor TaxID=60889 RepID=A0AA40KPW3_9HYME|nr:hypothetical protein K0M31_002847 [Melipona bicolor]